MLARNFFDVLVVSPESRSYGGIFASELAGAMNTTRRFREVFHETYFSGALGAGVSESVKMFTENRRFDAVVFAGKPEDFSDFAKILSGLGVNLPVYGNDLMHVPGIEEIAKTHKLRLILPEDEPPAGAEEIWEFYGGQIVFLLRDVLEKSGNYDATKLADELRSELDAKRLAGEYNPKVRLVELDFSGVPESSENSDACAQPGAHSAQQTQTSAWRWRH